MTAYTDNRFENAVSRRFVLKASLASLGAVALGGLTACGSGDAGSADAAKKIAVAASPAPHAEILTDFAAPLLAEQGIELKVKEYTDYIQPNKDTTSGSVDANYFQHITYLENYNAENGTDLVSAGLITMSRSRFMLAPPATSMPSPTVPPSPSRTTRPTRVAPCCFCRTWV